MVDTFEWAVGIFEGEGCMLLRPLRATSPLRHNFMMNVQMTDEDVVRRLIPLFGGNVYGPFGPYAGHRSQKSVYRWQLSGRKAEELGWRMRPLLSQRRRRIFDEKIDYLEENRRRCSGCNGHLDDEQIGCPTCSTRHRVRRRTAALAAD